MRGQITKTAIVVLTVVLLISAVMPVYADNVVYKRGDKGEIITEAQKALKQLGFFNEECTGYFGEITEKAVKTFQTKYRLAVDGKLGPVTLALLKKLAPDSNFTSRGQAGRDISKSDVNYTVKQGDTIWDIAVEYNVTVKSIMQANKLGDNTVLKIGQKLLIPDVVSYIKPQSGANASTGDTKSGNTGFTVYIVKEGDTLWSIAEDFGATVETILKLNGLTKDSILQIDQEIKIPETEATVSDNPKTPDAAVDAEKGSDTVDKDTNEEATPGKGEYLDWFGVVDGIFKNGDIATVTDIDTGKSFKVRRLYGRNHADVEPLTKEDTAIMKSIYGEWSWDRRAIIVSIDERQIAASMNGMPHGGEEIMDNDFDGQFCIHFKGSKTHAGNKVDPGHQAAVRKAAGLK